MSGGRNQKLWDAIDTLMALGSVAILAGLTVAYFAVAGGLPKDNTGDPAGWRPFAMSILTNMIPVFALFSVGFFTLRTLNRIRAAEDRDELLAGVSAAAAAAVGTGPTGGTVGAEGYARFRSDPPLGQLIAASSTIRIVVHYFDTWLNDNEDALLAFFDRGGKLLIVTPNPADGNLVAAVQARFTGTTKAALESKIRGTLEKAASIHKRSRRNDAVLEGYTLPFLPLYCAVQFDGRELMLSPYEHLREVAVKSPAFMYHLVHFPAVRDWFDKEFAYLVSKAVKVK